MNIIMNSDDWKRPIEAIPMNQYYDTLGDSKLYDSKKVIVSADHDRLFGVFPKKSVVVEHEEAVNVVNDALKRLYGTDPEIKLTSLKEGAQIVAEFNLPDEKPVDIGNGDLSNFHLLLYNAYDKALPFKVQMGCMRLVCTNGMVLGKEINSIKAKELLDGWTPEHLSKKIEIMTKKSHSIVDTWRHWTTIQIPQVVAEASFESKFSKKFIEPILDPSNYPLSKWELYNLMTARSTHDSQSERAKRSFDQMISKIFYGSKSPMYDFEKTLEIPDEEISSEQTATEEIYHI